MTIAVNLNGPAENSIGPTVVTAAPQSHSSAFREKIDRFIGRLQPSMPGGGSRDWGPYEIAMQGFEAMQSTIARQQLAAYPPDTIIEIARNACKTLEFDRAAEMIALGYSKARMCDFSDLGWAGGPPRSELSSHKRGYPIASR